MNRIIRFAPKILHTTWPAPCHLRISPCSNEQLTTHGATKRNNQSQKNPPKRRGLWLSKTACPVLPTVLDASFTIPTTMSYMPDAILPPERNREANSTHQLSRLDVQRASTDIKRFVEARLEKDFNLVKASRHLCRAIYFFKSIMQYQNSIS